MIRDIVKQWDQRKDALREWLSVNHPGSYQALVKQLVTLVLTEPILRDGDSYDYAEPIDLERLTVVDHGSYQGVLVFLFCREGYQPDADDYLWFDNYYGSCSGCDTLEAIRGYSDEPPNEDQVSQYMDLALHMVQRIKWLVTDTSTEDER